MKFLKKFVFPFLILSMLVTSCEEEANKLDENYDIDSYEFTSVDKGDDNYHYDDIEDEPVDHNPYEPIEDEDPYEEIDINEDVDPEFPKTVVTYPEVIAPTYETEEIDDSLVTPDNVEYAITDISKNIRGKQLNILEDDAYYANLAIELAKNEISHMGFETFKAIAVVYNETTKEVDHYIPGIAFSEGTIYDFAENEAIYSCGFLQVRQEGEENKYFLSDTNSEFGIDASSGIFVYPSDENDNRRFIIESNAIVEGFSGVYDSHYFSYKQESTFVINVESKLIQGDIENYADEELELYDFNKQEYLYKPSVFHKEKDLSAYGLYGERGAKAYQQALQILDEAIKIQEKNGIQIALNNIVIISPELLDSLTLANQRESLNKTVNRYLNAIELKENEYLMLDKDGEFTIGVDYNYSAARESQLARGIIKTLSSIGMLGAGFACIVATGGMATPILATLNFVGGFGSTLFATSELIEGAQDFYAGATGLDGYQAINPIKDQLCNLVGDELGTKIYYATGFVSMLSTTVFGPINTVLQSAKFVGAGVVQTVLSITRVTVVTLAKVLGSAAVSSQIYKIVQKAADKAGLSILGSKLLSFGTAALAGFLTYKGLDSVDKAFNLSGIQRVRPVTQEEIDAVQTPEDPTGEISQIGGKPIKPRKSNDVDLIDGVNSKYMEKNFYYKNQWAKEIIKHGYYDQGVTTSIHTKTYYPEEEFIFGPLMRRGILDETDEEEFSPVAGFYDPSTHTIYLNASVINSDGIRTLRTIAHLMRHAYQFEHAEFNSPVMKALRKSHYVYYDESLYDYLNNPAEVDANAYADYIVARAYAAYQAKLDDPNLMELFVDEYYTDPVTFKEAH